MKRGNVSARLFRVAAACGAAFLLATAAAASCTMTLKDGFICVVDHDTGNSVYCSDVPAAMLSQRDRLLLEAGIPLETQADFTRALEDFCS